MNGHVRFLSIAEVHTQPSLAGSRPFFWAALARAAARQQLYICGTDSKAQWFSENLLRN